MSHCIFCQILAGQAPGTFLYRDETCAAFLDIRPVNPGHLLVVPVRHATSLAEMDNDTAGAVMSVGLRLAAALRKSGLRCEGVNLFLADGVAAGQEVFHVHLHVLPRFSGDGFGLRLGPDYGQQPPRETLEALAAQIRAGLSGPHSVVDG